MPMANAEAWRVNRRSSISSRSKEDRSANPGFGTGALDDDGYPAWITGLDNDDNTNHTVHVVRGLAPADALQVAGARPAVITSCRLPAQRPDNGTSLPRAAIGPTDSGAVLLAGRIGPWSFVAGLNITLDELRKIPLLAAPFS